MNARLNSKNRADDAQLCEASPTLTSYQRGLAGEARACETYQASGAEVLGQRCRTQGGEIDIVLRQPHALFGDIIVFAEVKRRKSLRQAGESLQPRQQARIARAAEIWLADHPEFTGATCRFDAVLLDEDGNMEVVENAWMA